MPSILGLTGNIASGKTTIGLMLLELGATEYVDADLVVHELYLPGRPLVAQLVEAFGRRIRDAEGGGNRRVLGELAFGDPARLRQLEGLVHPAVQTALIERLRALPPGGIGVLDAIKLVESGYGPLCHGLWLVTCPPEIQLPPLLQTPPPTPPEAHPPPPPPPPTQPHPPLPPPTTATP